MSESANPSGGWRSAFSAFATAAAVLGFAITLDEPLARHTTFRIGGPADLYAAAATVEQLERLAELAAAHGIPATILGGGSKSWSATPACAGW